MVLCDERVYVWGDPETGVKILYVVYWKKTDREEKI